MRDLQVDYLDLYMLHSPISNRDLQASTWKALEVLYRSGKIKALGVSNFSGRELRSLVETSEVLPMVVQNKFDVYHLGKQLDNQGDDVVAYARSKGIVIVGYSSLSSFPFSMLPAHDPIINYVASKQASPTTSSQVILRWILQLGGTAVIPRSTNPDRLKENLDVLNMAPLPDEHMHLINMLQYLIASPVNKAV
jgi:2,5-diketo-D-gluconate reductase A